MWQKEVLVYAEQLTGSEGLDRIGLDLDAFADGLPGGFFIYEAHGEERILFANRQMEEIFRCDSKEDFLDHVGGTFPGIVYHEDRLRVENNIWAQINAPDAHAMMHRDHVTYRIAAKDGTLHYCDEYGRLVVNTKLGDVFFVFVAEITPTTENKTARGKEEDHEHRGVDLDVLTGLPSMHYYQTHASEYLAEAACNGTDVVVVFFDVDHFRTVNYRLGYEGGDEVLQRIAATLRQEFKGDLLARFADDHFVLVTQAEGLVERLNRIHDKVHNLVQGMSIEIKCGIYDLEDGVTTVAFAHDRAKVACAGIKGRYDHFYRYYDETLALHEDMHSYIIEHLDQAVEEGWIRNYYQPVVRVATGECCGMEALSRWVDPELGMISPGHYIHVLEEARLIHMIDRAVIERACADIKRNMQHTGAQLPISLNFSPSALALLDVPTLLKENTERYGIDPHLIHVEITESSLTEDPNLLRMMIARLHEEGFEVWMDDFGSGYSSLNLLKDYDFDVLKIDMEFLRGMEGSHKSQTIVRTISDLAHSLGMLTLVEGVETKGQLSFLKKVGTDIAQGFLFSEPVPLEAIQQDFFLRYPPEHKAPKRYRP